MAKSPQASADKWAQRVGASTQAYKDGISGVQSSPMDKAADKLDKALQNYTEAVTSGRMGNALRGTPMSFWKSQAMNGAAKLAAGATKGAPKMLKHQQAFAPVYAAMTIAAANAPDDPVAKFAAANAVIMAAKGTGKGY